MWTCPICQRPFRRPNTVHICNEKTVDDIFADSPDNVLLAFDDVLLATAEWEPNSIAAGRRAAMLSNVQVWLVLRPYKKWLDVSFYTDAPMTGDFLHKSGIYTNSGNKFQHTIRLHGPGELSPEAIDAMRKGYDWAMK